MKRLTLIIFTAVIMFTIIVPFKTHADFNTEQNEITDDLNDILSDYNIDLEYGDISSLSFDEIRDRIGETLSERLHAPLRILGIMLAVILFTSFMKGVGEGILKDSGGIYNMICVLTASAVFTPSLFTIYESVISAIEQMGGFMLVFVPVFTGITIASGGAVTGSVYNILVLGASQAFAAVTENYLMPVLCIMAALAVSGSIFPNLTVNSIISLIKKLITYGMTIFVTLFTGFVTLKSTLASKTDGTATKTVKYMISGFVPIVGGAVSDAYSTVKGSFDVIRSTVGTAGCLAIALIMLPPIIELLIFRTVMWISSAAADLVSAEAVSKLVKGIDNGLAIAQSVMICYAIMLILCTGIVVQLAA